MMLQTQTYLPSQSAPKRKQKPPTFFLLKKIALEIAEGKISESFFDKQRSKYKTSHSYWNCETRETGIYIDINTIPDRHKYFPPDEIVLELAAQIKEREQEAKWNGSADQGKIYQIQGYMLEARKEHVIYYNQIKAKHPTMKPDKIALYAQQWAVWLWIVDNYSRFPYCLEIYHTAYSKLFCNHFTGDTSKHAFKNFHSKCIKEGVEAAVIDLRSVTKVKHRRSENQMALLQSLYIQSRKVTAPEAYLKLVGYALQLGEKPMSKANVKIIFREFEKNAELFALRYGAGAAQKQLPYASLKPAQHRNTQWQIDGWTMPFWGADFQRYVLYLIRDNHSRKIIGYSIAETENTTLILEAMEDAMRNTGVFPGELVSDKHSFHKTKIAARLRAETERMGAVWTVTINAQRNQLAERYNQYLDSECKEFAGYTGKNRTATSKDARPAPEALTELAKTRNFKTIEEIKAIAAFTVMEFNNKQLDVLDGMSPNEKYAKSESLKAFAISETQRIALLRPVSTYKVIRGQITIKVGMRKHEFQLPAELISRYNDTDVVAVWEDLTQGIYISDIQTGEELGCIMPKVKIHGAIPDQNEADRNRINQQTGRTKGVTIKARKNALQIITEGLQQHPEAIELINHYSIPKDIRALAQQNNNLKRAIAEQGINTNMIPVRQEAAQVISMPVKTKERPFAASNNTMKKLTLDEILSSTQS